MTSRQSFKAPTITQAAAMLDGEKAIPEIRRNLRRSCTTRRARNMRSLWNFIRDTGVVDWFEEFPMRRDMILQISSNYCDVDHTMTREWIGRSGRDHFNFERDGHGPSFDADVAASSPFVLPVVQHANIFCRSNLAKVENNTDLAALNSIDWGFTSAYRRTHIRTGSAGSLSMFQQPNGPASGHHASEEELRCILEFHQQNEPIIKLTDTQSRIRWCAPSSGTRNEEDQAPVESPLRECPQQNLPHPPAWSDLVPEGFRPGRFLRQRQQHHSEEQNGEILSELATIKTNGTLTCNVTVYSINGGAHAQVQTVSKIDDSFPGVDSIEHKPSGLQLAITRRAALSMSNIFTNMATERNKAKFSQSFANCSTRPADFICPIERNPSDFSSHFLVHLPKAVPIPEGKHHLEF
ncbi:vesicle associated protein [Culex quinquefasciatus]|uniref:Vesicle associated protein n=1 Tax=Culex quinquefasciatus TaxID=7176 RepID=B0WTU2_CULQU|nr:vesicle associated protein [Culex quinquefasciatus]|eukprot:XP_001855869.1 vesicle associated protein [Culex quinquefasciatus]